MKAYDLLVQAESGLCSITGLPEGPGRVGVSACDVSCGMYSYMAVLEALIARDATGEGSSIKTSLFAGMADWMTVPLLHYDYGEKIMPRVGLNHPSIHPYGAYDTEDGGQILIAIQNEREFGRLCETVLIDADLPKDPRFESNEARCANRPEFDAVINNIFNNTDRNELVRRLRAASIAFGEVNDVAGLSDHPALRRVQVGSPTGPVDMVAPPALIDNGVRELGDIPPVGAHTENNQEGIRRMSGETDFSGWIGKSETEYGVASAYAANYFTLTLDRDDPLFVDGDPLPPAWHYFYFHELVALAATGEDGHRAKGDFMPPLPFPRRMWAGSKMTFESHPHRRAGEEGYYHRRHRDEGR